MILEVNSTFSEGQYFDSCKADHHLDSTSFLAVNI